MGLSSLNHKEKKTIGRSNNFLDIQTANGFVVSDKGLHQGAWRSSVDIMWWKIHRQCHRWEDYAMSLVFFLIRGRQEKLPDYQKVRK